MGGSGGGSRAVGQSALKLVEATWFSSWPFIHPKQTVARLTLLALPSDLSATSTLRQLHRRHHCSHLLTKGVPPRLQVAWTLPPAFTSALTAAAAASALLPWPQ